MCRNFQRIDKQNCSVVSKSNINERVVVYSIHKMQLNQLLVDDSHEDLADQKSLFSLPNKNCRCNFHDRLQVIANVGAPCSMKEQYQVSTCAQSVLRISFGLDVTQLSFVFKCSSDVLKNVLR